jgi:hypothetical protein
LQDTVSKRAANHLKTVFYNNIDFQTIAATANLQKLHCREKTMLFLYEAKSCFRQYHIFNVFCRFAGEAQYLNSPSCCNPMPQKQKFSQFSAKIKLLVNSV